jgi:hypothetical protein
VHDLQILVRTALLLAGLIKAAPAPRVPAGEQPAAPTRHVPPPDEDDTPTIVLSPYAPLRPGGAPTILMAPHGTTLDDPEEDDVATIIMARHLSPVTDGATMLITDRQPRWRDDGESTVVMAAMPADPGTAPAPAPAQVGQVPRQTVPYLAPEARSQRRSPTAAEAGPATIIASGKLDQLSLAGFYLTLLAVVMAGASIGSILVLWIR